MLFLSPTTPLQHGRLQVSGIFRACSVLAVCLFLAGAAHAQTTFEDGLDNVALDFETSSFYKGTGGAAYPEGLWTYTAADSNGMGDADSATSSLPVETFSRIDTEIEGPAYLTFWWKIDSHPDDSGTPYDVMGFSSSDDHYLEISGVTDWAKRTVLLDFGTHDVTWFFDRETGPDSSIEFGEAWLDEVAVAPIPNVPDLQDAMETTYQIHSTEWSKVAMAGSIGGDAAQSNAIGDGESATMMFEVEGPATISFDWGLEGDPSAFSRLRFFVDGQSATTNLTGQGDKNTRSLELGPGTHRCRFIYVHDAPNDPDYMGGHFGYVDNLAITPFVARVTLSAALDFDGDVFASEHWTYQNSTTQVDHDAVSVSSYEPKISRRLYIPLPKEAGLLRFWVKTDTDSQGYLYTYIDDKEIDRFTGDTEWQEVQVNVGPGTDDRHFMALFHRFANLNGSSPLTEAYLDGVSFEVGETNFRPDLSIKGSKGGARGRRIHNSSGAGQLAKFNGSDFEPYGIFTVYCHNNCPTDRDFIRLRGTKSNRHFRTRVFLKANDLYYNYTSQIVTGRYVSERMDPGAVEEFEYQVIRKRSSKRRGAAINIVASSAADPSHIDVVKGKLKIKRIRR